MPECYPSRENPASPATATTDSAAGDEDDIAGNENTDEDALAVMMNEADVFIGDDNWGELNSVHRGAFSARCTSDEPLECDVPEYKLQAFTYACEFCEARLMPSKVYKLGSPCCSNGVEHACESQRDIPPSYKNHTPCCNNDAVGVYHPRRPTSRNLASYAAHMASVEMPLWSVNGVNCFDRYAALVRTKNFVDNLPRYIVAFQFTSSKYTRPETVQGAGPMGFAIEGALYHYFGLYLTRSRFSSMDPLPIAPSGLFFCPYATRLRSTTRLWCLLRFGRLASMVDSLMTLFYTEPTGLSIPTSRLCASRKQTNTTMRYCSRSFSHSENLGGPLVRRGIVAKSRCSISSNFSSPAYFGSLDVARHGQTVPDVRGHPIRQDRGQSPSVPRVPPN